jgi:hypothetical protein
MTITLGADPEIFFARSGEPVSAIGMIGGSKDRPRPLGDDFFILEDNVAAEFNIPPANTFLRWDENLKRGVEFVRKFATDNGCELSPRASATFAEPELESPQAKEFGCEPDFNAWTMMVNERPTATNQAFRTCGGHIHVGGIEDMDLINVIRSMDLFLGVPSIMLDKDRERRQLYGKAGCFRPKSYGGEYRTLSNFWIFDEGLRQWAWEQTHKAIEFAANNNLAAEDDWSLLIQETINSGYLKGYEALAGAFPGIAVAV